MNDLYNVSLSCKDLLPKPMEASQPLAGQRHQDQEQQQEQEAERLVPAPKTEGPDEDTVKASSPETTNFAALCEAALTSESKTYVSKARVSGCVCFQPPDPSQLARTKGAYVQVIVKQRLRSGWFFGRACVARSLALDTLQHLLYENPAASQQRFSLKVANSLGTVLEGFHAELIIERQNKGGHQFSIALYGPHVEEGRPAASISLCSIDDSGVREHFRCKLLKPAEKNDCAPSGSTASKSVSRRSPIILTGSTDNELSAQPFELAQPKPQNEADGRPHQHYADLYLCMVFHFQGCEKNLRQSTKVGVAGFSPQLYGMLAHIDTGRQVAADTVIRSSGSGDAKDLACVCQDTGVAVQEPSEESQLPPLVPFRRIPAWSAVPPSAIAQMRGHLNKQRRNSGNQAQQAGQLQKQNGSTPFKNMRPRSHSAPMHQPAHYQGGHEYKYSNHSTEQRTVVHRERWSHSHTRMRAPLPLNLDQSDFAGLPVEDPEQADLLSPVQLQMVLGSQQPQQALQPCFVGFVPTTSMPFCYQTRDAMYFQREQGLNMSPQLGPGYSFPAKVRPSMLREPQRAGDLASKRRKHSQTC